MFVCLFWNVYQYLKLLYHANSFELLGGRRICLFSVLDANCLEAKNAFLSKSIWCWQRLQLRYSLIQKRAIQLSAPKKEHCLQQQSTPEKGEFLRLFFSIFCRFSFNLLIHNNQWELSFQKYDYSCCRLKNTFVWKVSKKGKIYLTGAEKQQPNPCKYHQSIQHPRQSKNKLAYRWVIADRDARMLCYSFLVINVLDLRMFHLMWNAYGNMSSNWMTNIAK